MTNTIDQMPDYELARPTSQAEAAYDIEEVQRDLVRLIRETKKRRHMSAYRAALYSSVNATSRKLDEHDLLRQSYLSYLSAEVRSDRVTLENRVRILEHLLSCDRPYLQLYRVGACVLLAAVLSLIMSAVVGIGVPFHPVFALVAIPASIGVIVMAFLIKPKKEVGGLKMTSIGALQFRRKA